MVAMQAAANQLQMKGLGSKNFAMVNFEDPNDKHKKKLKIRKVDPTLRWYVNGKATPYKGGEKMEDIVIHVLEQTGNLGNDYVCAKLKTGPKLASYHLNMMYVGDKKGDLYNSYI